MARKGLSDFFFDAGTRFVTRAAEVVLSDPRGKEVVARAIGLAQKGQKRLKKAQEEMLRAAGIPGRQEYEDLAKQLARIKRKTRDLAETLEAEDREEDALHSETSAETNEVGGDEGPAPCEDGDHPPSHEAPKRPRRR